MSTTRRPLRGWVAPSLLVGAVIMLWLLLGLAPVLFAPDWEVRGQLGDMFGVANALFSALALGGILFTILLQRDELALQRQELELTRKELARSAAAQEAAERNLGQQARALESTATLTALNAVVEHYRSKVRASTGVSAIITAQAQLDKYTSLLESELARLLEGTNRN